MQNEKKCEVNIWGKNNALHLGDALYFHRGSAKRSLFNEMSKLEDMGKLEPVFDALRGSWDDIDASWVYVMDTDKDGKVTVYSDYSGSGINLLYWLSFL